MGKLKTVINRIYSDYLMSSRLIKYDNIIKKTLDKGYEHLTVREYCKLLQDNNIQNSKKYFVNRHDIDTDLSTAKEFFKIEKKYGVKATYYFRLSTLDFNFMREIEEYGSEASYHFEEIAQFAKDNHIKSKEEILKSLDEIKNIFKENLFKIEKQLGQKIVTVCSYGDFTNRKLKIVNNEIIKDLNLRKELGIKCEAYDKLLLDNMDIYISDKPYPKFWSSGDINTFIDKEKRIYILTHPRQWRVKIVENTKDNLKRLYEGIIW